MAGKDEKKKTGGSKQLYFKTGKKAKVVKDEFVIKFYGITLTKDQQKTVPEELIIRDINGNELEIPNKILTENEGMFEWEHRIKATDYDGPAILEFSAEAIINEKYIGPVTCNVELPIKKKPEKCSIKLRYDKRMRTDESKQNYVICLHATILEDGKLSKGRKTSFFDDRQEKFAESYTHLGIAIANKMIPVTKSGREIGVRARVEIDGEIYEDEIKFQLPNWPEHIKIKPKNKFGIILHLIAARELFQKPKPYIVIISMLVFSSLILHAFSRLEALGSAILAGILMALLSAWTSRQRDLIGVGAIWGLIYGVICYFFPQFFETPIRYTAWIFLSFGPLTWIFEEITDDDIKCFPWWIMYFCIVLALYNVFEAVMVATFATEEYMNQLYVFAGKEHASWAGKSIAWLLMPATEHYGVFRLTANSSRIVFVIMELLDAFVWLATGLICFAVAAPGEITKWWNRLHIGNLKELLAGFLGLIGFKQAQSRRKQGE